jgi:hypothetical protein
MLLFMGDSKISINPEIYFVIQITISNFAPSERLAYPASRNH